MTTASTERSTSSHHLHRHLNNKPTYEATHNMKAEPAAVAFLRDRGALGGDLWGDAAKFFTFTV